MSEAENPAPEESVVPHDGDQAVVVPDGPDEFEEGAPLPYPVVAIGASAGGVEAYIELFTSLSPKTGMAFIVLPHLSADQKSHMVEILKRQTAMPVEEIAEGVRPDPDHVYVLPPNTRARIERGVLRLEPRSQGAPPKPIDYFLRSLASDQKSRAIGVILSGTDGDGALGIKAIKGEGGITIVQSPESARFAEMPRSSIFMDHIDRILPPAKIAAELTELGAQFHQPSLNTLDGGNGRPGEERSFARILSLMRGVSGVDFRLYKPSTVRRRIARRMLLHRMQTLAEYAAYLQQNPKELRELQEDALINVTRFFRDPQVFDALKEIVLPRIFAAREPDRQLRIWVAGCSSGEEVYSIVICILEFLAGQPFEPSIQIFGTDVSDLSIQRARLGVYSESIAGEVSAERLRRFFVKVDRGYQVAKRVRDLCIFARQNLCHDPPFSKMDLITCRNVLIYLDAEMQKQILPTFHYALRPNGYLLLGTSETIREFTDLFHLLDRKSKLFVKIGNGSQRATMGSTPGLFLPDSAALPAQPALPEHWDDGELQRAADRIVLARYGPAGVVINDRLEILQSRGHTSDFLEMPQGSVSLHLSRMLSENVASSIIDAVRHAIENDAPARLDRVQVSAEAPNRDITVEVLPIHSMTPRSRCFLVLFLPSGGAPSPEVREEIIPDGHERDQAVERLRRDLASTKLHLQTLIEERDAKNQELVSANEEIQSANEEMQSTNEELETTKEELQSSNEELQTVNDELQQRNVVLTQTTNDLSNLLNSVNLPVLMLSNELTIRHFTPPTQRLMNLRDPDVGRPFSEIRLNLVINDLEPLFHEVQDSLAPREVEVQDKEGHWYLLRVRPYRTTENKINGLVVVLLDIDQLRRSQQELRGARDFARSVLESVPLPLAVIDLNRRIRMVNDAFRRLSGITGEALEKRNITELASALWGLDGPLRANLDQLQAAPDSARSFEFEHKTSGENSKTLLFRARVLQPDGELFLLITVEDISVHREVERLLNEERERLTSEVASTAQKLGRTQDELRALTANLFTSQEDERRRVARELHDDVLQKLAALEIDLQQIETNTGGSGKAASGLSEARDSISSLSADVRGISHALHSSVIDDLGLSPALRNLTSDFQEREQMIVTFQAEDVPEHLPQHVATALYRIAQEGLRNVAKHAGRTHVKVVLKGGADGIRLQISDAGHGFDTAVRGGGLGLISMEERARMVEGTFSIESQPGEGTRVTVVVPLR